MKFCLLLFWDPLFLRSLLPNPSLLLGLLDLLLSSTSEYGISSEEANADTEKYRLRYHHTYRCKLLFVHGFDWTVRKTSLFTVKYLLTDFQMVHDHALGSRHNQRLQRPEIRYQILL